MPVKTVNEIAEHCTHLNIERNGSKTSLDKQRKILKYCHEMWQDEKTGVYKNHALHKIIIYTIFVGFRIFRLYSKSEAQQFYEKLY